jgi:general stress protein 26
MKNEADTKKELLEIVRDFEYAMLVTVSGRDLHGRPMAIAGVEEDGDLYFSSHIDSTKVQEIEIDPNVAVTMQTKMKFATLYGSARVVRDRELIERMWKPDWKVWFPEGKSDPSLCLIRVNATHGEYWDNTGAKGIRYVLQAAKALVTKSTPSEDRDQTAKVTLK